MRCTENISNKVQNIFDSRYGFKGIVGEEPEFITIKEASWGETLDNLRDLLKRLLGTEQFSAKQLSILVPHSRDIDLVKGYAFDDKSSIESKKINVSSVSKYKGLENDFIIIAGVENYFPENIENMSLLYAALLGLAGLDLPDE